MIREGKYIIRRILIGVGIVLVLSMINSCKVKALSTSDMTSRESSYNTIINDNNYYEYGTYDIGNRTIKIMVSNDNDSICYGLSNVSSPTAHCVDLNFSFKQLSILYGNGATGSPSATNSTDNYLFFVITDNKENVLGVKNFPSYNQNFSLYCRQECLFFRAWFSNGGNGYINSPRQINVLNNSGLTFTSLDITYFQNTGYFSNYDIYNYDFTNILYDLNISISPEFVSWNYTKNTSNNVITGYTFSPEFSNFDTENYTYYYKFGNSNWLTLTENEQNININANGTIYVKVVENSSSDIIDSATFTITDLGTFENNQNYNITFSGEYRTENYLNNNISSKSQSIIQEYQIYVDYSPKSSILKYQYQYVVNDSSLDNNNWTTLASGNNGSFTYVASENGTLYARILDPEDNVLTTATFTVNSIGLLAFDNNEEGINNFFTKLSNKISYGGPISNLFRIPIDILNRIYSYSSSSCSPYKISTLLGTDIVLPCYNFKNIFGNTIYTLFDSLLCFILSLCLFKFIRNIYDKFINMEDISS